MSLGYFSYAEVSQTDRWQVHELK